jgi:hypothetical protein
VHFSDSKSTLAYHLHARPLGQHLSFEGMPCSVLGMRAKYFLEHMSLAAPETEALWFYLGNHALHALRRKRALQEPLPAKELQMVEQVFARSNKVFLRLLFYTTVICVREARHFGDSTGAVEKLAKEQGLTKAFKFSKTISDSASGSMEQFIQNAPKDLTMGELAKVLSLIFNKGKWQGGYGGKAWGSIADCLLALVTGEYSPEMFCDLAFALQHNNGSMFNKGIIRRATPPRRVAGYV